jgi:trigger factor
MKVEVGEESTIRKNVQVTIEPATFDKHLSKAYANIGKKAKLKGFRPGKVPRPILEKHYSQDAQNEAMKAVVNETYPQALAQENIHAVSYPEIEIVQFKPGQDLVYKAHFDVRPEIKEVKSYTKLKLTAEDTTPDADAIKNRLEEYRQAHAKVIPIDPPRSIEESDVLVFDYLALRDGKPFEGNEVNGYMAELGTGVLLPDFEAQLQGLSLNDTKEINVTLPDDFADKNFSGKKMTYTVTIKEIKQKQVPGLDDDFAKDLGLENLPALQEKVKAELVEHKTRAVRADQHGQIVDKLLKNNDILVPNSMIDSELAAMFDQWKHNLQGQGQTPEALGITDQDFNKKNRDEAVKRIQAMLLFEAIWRKEEISVESNDRDNKMEELARLSGQQVLQVKQYYETNPSQLAHLDVMVLEDKTLDFILSQATIKIRKAKKAE